MKYLKHSAIRTLLMCIACSLTGCVSTDGVSLPISFPAGSQYKVKSAADWQLIAEEVAIQMKRALMAQDQLQTPIYLEELTHPSAFERSFVPMLRESLLSQGLKVSAKHQDAAVLKVHLSKVSLVESYRSPPELELILSVNVQKEGQYLASSNQIYYLFSKDPNMYHHFLPPPPTSRNFPVLGLGDSK
jgi:hypothetical protein